MSGRWLGVIMLLAAGAWGEVWPPAYVGMTPAPAGSVGVGYECGPLYTLVDSAPPMVFQLDPRSGSVLGSFALPIPLGVQGITYAVDGNHDLFVSNRLNSHIYRLTAAGSLLSSFYFPYGPPYSIGFTTAGFENHGTGTGLFVACRNNNRIYRISTTGSLISSFAGPASAVVGYDEWFAVDDNTPTLFWDYFGTWQAIASLPALPTAAATGVDYVMDSFVNTYVLGRDGRLYRFSGVTGITSTSFGRVRTLFR